MSGSLKGCIKIASGQALGCRFGNRGGGFVSWIAMTKVRFHIWWQMRCCTLCICYIIGHIIDQPILNALRASAKATNSWLPISLPKPPFLIAAHCRCKSGKLCHQVSTMFVVHFLFSLLCCNTQYTGVVAQHSHQISNDFHPRTSKKHHYHH